MQRYSWVHRRRWKQLTGRWIRRTKVLAKTAFQCLYRKSEDIFASTEGYNFYTLVVGPLIQTKILTLGFTTVVGLGYGASLWWFDGGTLEQNLRSNALKTAESISPAILFIDELGQIPLLVPLVWVTRCIVHLAGSWFFPYLDARINLYLWMATAKPSWKIARRILKERAFRWNFLVDLPICRRTQGDL